MPIAEVDYPRFAIHEASHAAVAIMRGFYVYGTRIDGPNFRPGGLWREFPEGISAENDQGWAQHDLAVFAAGYLGELHFFPGTQNREEWVTGSDDADRMMVDYCAVQALEIPADIAILQAPNPPPKTEWRNALPQPHWDQYDDVIQHVTNQVNAILALKQESIRAIARLLLAEGFVVGSALYNLMNVHCNYTRCRGEWIEDDWEDDMPLPVDDAPADPPVAPDQPDP